jgi:predicted phosphoribosyltransferase
MKNEVFQSRNEAARRLASQLCMESSDAIVLAVPTRGVLVGHRLALELGCMLDIVVPEKIPIPWNTDASMGAVTSDGARVINRTMVKALGLSEDAVRMYAEEARKSAVDVEGKYRNAVPPVDISGRRVIIVDDGISSGYTMLAAIESAAGRSPARLTVAVPVSSIAATRLLVPKVDELIALVISERQPFWIDDFYLENAPMDDDSIVEYLRRSGR